MAITTPFDEICKRNYELLLSLIEYPSDDEEERWVVKSVLLSLTGFKGVDIQLIAGQVKWSAERIYSLLKKCKFHESDKGACQLFRFFSPQLQPALVIINLTSEVHDYLNRQKESG